MENNKIINFKKRLVLKRITNTPKNEELLKQENESNSNELILKNIELYEPVSYEDLVKLNKKKYRNLKITETKNYLKTTLWNLEKVIENYKQLINRTEFWESKSTYEFNFEDWNTLKKANGKLTRYYNDIKKISLKIETEEL